ncbi:LOW QUALITY PROTEIN: transcription initiation factor TFIID subunit 7-like [Talpa occidentalis]|uniref:LOW QUALITY PROTEIN: transcription initiation factor TFIID subunit 7-like n=1 Tax=Talpa occidentalis TaxID=50954 RepID=UPI0023F904B7|nr:LOW QUALITY PROTEIN: transcription initiation factor TFIID subunit 7-like [Talpa occidentalis]
MISTEETTSLQGPPLPEAHRAEVACDQGAENVANGQTTQAPADDGPQAAADDSAQTAADHGAQAAADHGAQAAADEGTQAGADDGAQTLADDGAQTAADDGAQTSEDHGAHAAADDGAQAAADHGAQAAADHGAQAAADHGTQTAADHGTQTPQEKLKEGKEQEMNKTPDQPPHELENQFILRLPLEHASTVRKIVHSRYLSMKDNLRIDLSPGRRHAVVEIEDVSLAAKLVDLPCVIGSLKTLDKKTFYKTASISQMLVCTAAADSYSSLEESFNSADVKAGRKSEKEKQKKYVWKHGITPPLKNVRKKRFRKTKKKTNDFKQLEEVNLTEEKCIPAKHRVFNDIPSIPAIPPWLKILSLEVEKEVKRLLYSDAEAVSARWEVIGEDGTKEIESQGSIPGFAVSPGLSGYKQKRFPSEHDILRDMFRDSSSNSSDEEDEDEEEYDYDEEEEDFYEEDMERKLQAKFLEARQSGGKEVARSVVVEIQKYIDYLERKLQNIQNKAQRQRNLIMKVENLTLKNHLKNVLEQLKLQEKQKIEQLIYLREQLRYFLEK